MRLFGFLPKRRVAVPVCSYDADAGRWSDHESGGPVDRTHVTVATFNIWFNELYRQQRYQAIAELLSRERPDVMVFQEVTDAALDVFGGQTWIRQGYRRAAVIGDHNYGMLMLSRLPVQDCTYTRLPSRLNRGCLSARFTVNGRDLVIGCVHLESGKAARQLRARQLTRLFRAVAADTDVVLLGDFNLRDTENDALDPTYRDVWPQLRPGEPGFTEDTSINLMRYDMKNKHRHVRFDRVLVKGQAWQPTEIRLLGVEPIAPSLQRIFPSDHFGVLCRLSAQSGAAQP
ncbi:endonuclease [Mycolicibacterium sp. 018/SC-01/001]|uniref:endonuclease/exonuclease/phosphatase family protein n=1 Tax=Mycolicibacterium sp. 018/SC-01/001 TaxID=2592069 RepID=UPI0011812847|nr:endonuclease/exonuclease/phosphatase family protein [Mycolicibacterium sp. 018/SC-01/001]TRW86131.1 endonuclease [Mycolicibacterium sp. 018/SC-01/001]